MKFIRPMLIGMFIGSLGSSLFLSSPGRAGKMGINMRRGLKLISLVGRELGRAAKRA